MKQKIPNQTGVQYADFPKKTGKSEKKGGLLGRILRRFLLVLVTLVILLAGDLLLVINMIFNGPSPTARDQLTMTLIEASATKWVPTLFIGEEQVAQIQSSLNLKLPDEVSDTTAVIINRGQSIGGNDEWANYPDGIRIEKVSGDIRDVQAACGAAVDGIVGPETLGKTVTLSETKNSSHPAVLPVQRRLLALGYSQIGEADGVAGQKFTEAVKAYQVANGCPVDGEITAKAQTWQSLLGL